MKKTLSFLLILACAGVTLSRSADIDFDGARRLDFKAVSAQEAIPVPAPAYICGMKGSDGTCANPVRGSVSSDLAIVETWINSRVCHCGVFAESEFPGAAGAEADTKAALRLLRAEDARSDSDKYYSMLHPVPGTSVTVDSRTELMWVSNQDDMGFGPGARMNWEPARQFCVSLEYAGYSDWRLPDMDELASIVETNRPAVNPAYFPNTWSSQYWTSSYGPDMDLTEKLTLDFTNGSNYTESKKFVASVRCVRSALN